MSVAASSTLSACSKLCSASTIPFTSRSSTRATAMRPCRVSSSPLPTFAASWQLSNPPPPLPPPLPHLTLTLTLTLLHASPRPSPLVFLLPPHPKSATTSSRDPAHSFC